MKIRMICAEDAQPFLELNHKLDAETKLMLFEPGERSTTVQQVEKRIEHTLARDNEAVFVLEDDGVLVGYGSVIGGHLKRNSHKASVVTGILQSHAGRGAGSSLFQRLLEWTKTSSLHRLELTVMKHNVRAIGLYQKFGFEIEGMKKDSLLIDGQYVDEYLMGCVLRKWPAHMQSVSQ